MLERSLAAGLEPMWSSFSRIVFSEATILRVAIVTFGVKTDGLRDSVW